jgi:hypothetical protein
MTDKPLILTFDDGAKGRVLSVLGLKSGKDKNLVDDNNKLLTDQEFNPINSVEFGGLLQGSKVAIRKDRSELAKYFVKKD